MLSFLAGFVIALIIAVATAAIFFINRSTKIDTQQGDDIQQLGRLTGELAHEIKNPLSTVKVSLKLIKEDLSDIMRQNVQSDQRLRRPLKKIDVIQGEVNRVEQILEGFMRYVGKIELQLCEVDINELVGDMTDFFSPLCRDNDITLRQLLADTPLIVRADPDLLKQVLLNIFLNAQHAMPDGGELMVKTQLRGKKTAIEISDTGCGIEVDKLSRIFEPYYSSRPGGRGLGLPTAKKIIDAHGGKISVDTEPGKGSSFVIELPLKTDD
ncbi:MAG: ATP-binding protein [Phycisphaerae bacterium]|nr:ATP-binding protein [Phycisphaerae bacterium]